MSSRTPRLGSGSSRPAPDRDSGLCDLESGLEATVCAYLRRQPDFFVRNPDLLAQLKVPHDTGGAVSLVEHQVTLLRRQLETEKGRLSHLITRAREYESLSNRLHALVLEIIPARGLDGLCETLRKSLTRELKADAVALRLFPVGPDAGGGDDPILAAFQDFLGREHALCGPLEADHGALLFGAAGERVRSAAIMPIRADDRCGVLAIGAADPERFRADMGTDLLDRLAEIVGCKLLSLPPEVLHEIDPVSVAAAHCDDPTTREVIAESPGVQPGG